MTDVTLFDDVEKTRGRSVGPIPWIGFDEGSDRYNIYPEALAYLKTLTRPLAIVSVVGLYRTGKSYLLNRILGVDKEHAFQVSPTVRSCTKGLWIMTPPLEMDGYDVLVVDTEGLGSLSATTSHDTRVFSLALLLSSMFLYNSCGAINETSLNNLSLVASIAKHIHVTSDDEASDDLAQCFPRFLWVARDFSLQLVDDEGEAIDPTTYFNGALTMAPNSDPGEAKNKVRAAINQLFPAEKRDCVVMVRPCIQEEDLQRLPELDDAQLRPEFVQALERLKTIIFDHAKPLTMPGQDGLVINGPLLASLCHTYVEAINSNKVPVIRDSWTLLSETECARATEECRDAWRRTLAQADTDATVEEITAWLRSRRGGILEQYDRQAVGTAAAQGREKLAQDIDAGVDAAVENARLRAKERMRARLQDVHKRALREATSVSDLIQLFEDDLDPSEAEFWYPEAFPTLVRAVESFTIRLEKRLLEVQRKADSADLEIANVRAEAKTQVAAAADRARAAEEDKAGLIDQLEASRRETADVRRHKDELATECRHKEEEAARARQSLEEQLRAALEEQADETTTAGAGGAAGGAASEEMTRRVAELTQAAIARESELEQCKDERSKADEAVDNLNGQVAELRGELESLLPLRIELEQAETARDEAAAALSAAESRLAEMEDQHEEESASIQKEAMETVTAIRGVLASERERSKKQQERAQATLKETQDQAIKQAKELDDRAERAEELARQRQNAAEDAKRLANKERDALRAEIERYSAMFKEHQATSNENRREWMNQLQEVQKVSTKRERDLIAEQTRLTREWDDRRRDLDMRVASAEAQLQAAERRRKAAEDDIVHMRDRLGKSESSGIQAARLQSEVKMVRDQKEKAQEEARRLSARVTMLERKVKDVRRACEAEKTKTSMQYERQISILESKLLQ